MHMNIILLLLYIHIYIYSRCDAFGADSWDEPRGRLIRSAAETRPEVQLDVERLGVGRIDAQLPEFRKRRSTVNRRLRSFIKSGPVSPSISQAPYRGVGRIIQGGTLYLVNELRSRTRRSEGRIVRGACRDFFGLRTSHL